MADSWLLRSTQTINEASDARQKTARFPWRVLVVVLLLVGSAGFAVFYFGLPMLTISQVVVDAPADWPDQAVLALAGIERGQTFLNTRVEHIEQRLLLAPAVRSAHVQKVFPDTIKLQIVPRTGIVTALVEIDGRTVPGHVSDDGVLFAIGSGPDDIVLPVINGLSFRGDTLEGARVATKFEEFLRDLSQLNRTQPELYDLFSEFTVIPRGEYHFDVAIHLVHTPVRVVIGPHLNAELTQIIVRTIHVLSANAQDLGVEEIDFRSPEVVYTVGGQQ